jgi:MYXO-CTERM domain-containing protein
VPAGAIPDNDPAGFTSDIVITDNFIVDDITISLNGLTHTWVGDLVVTLTHIDGGETSNLFNRVGKTNATTGFGDSSDLAGNYAFSDSFTGDFWAAAGGTTGPVPAGNYFASGALSAAKVNLLDAFGGINANGTWRLSIVDAAAGDLGALGDWSISFVKSPVPAPGALALLGLAGLAGGRRRRA